MNKVWWTINHVRFINKSTSCLTEAVSRPKGFYLKLNTSLALQFQKFPSLHRTLSHFVPYSPSLLLCRQKDYIHFGETLSMCILRVVIVSQLFWLFFFPFPLAQFTRYHGNTKCTFHTRTGCHSLSRTQGGAAKQTTMECVQCESFSRANDDKCGAEGLTMQQQKTICSSKTDAAEIPLRCKGFTSFKMKGVCFVCFNFQKLSILHIGWASSSRCLFFFTQWI